MGFMGGSGDKESVCNAGYLDLIPVWEYPLEKGRGTHPSILAWRIPWIEGESEREHVCVGERDPWPFGSSFYMFFCSPWACPM